MLFGSWTWPVGHLSHEYPRADLLLKQLQVANGLAMHWVLELFGMNCGHWQVSQAPQVISSISSWIWYVPVHCGLTQAAALVELWMVPTGHYWQVYPSGDCLCLHPQLAFGLAIQVVLNWSGMKAGHWQFWHLPHDMLSYGSWIWYCPPQVLLTHFDMFDGSWTWPTGHGMHEYPSIDLLVVQSGHWANGLVTHCVLELFGICLGHWHDWHLPHVLALIGRMISYCPIHCGTMHSLALFGFWTEPSGQVSQEYPSMDCFWVQGQVATCLLIHIVLAAFGNWEG